MVKIKDSVIVAVHPYESFVPREIENVLDGSISEDVYALGSATRSDQNLIGKDYISSQNSFDDQNGRGVFPEELADKLAYEEELIFVGGKLSECVPKAALSYFSRYGDVEDLAVEVNSVYEPSENGFESLAEIEDRGGNLPSSFSEVGGILEQYDCTF